jgi:proline iminopeptidase
MIGLLVGAHTPRIRDAQGKEVSGSVAVMEQMNIGGIEQWVVMRGRSASNPILLYLHGGPGGDLGALQRFNRELEEHFLVVYWVQRGAGKSYSADIPRESLTLGQFVSDTHEMVTKLLARFHQQKVFLVGQSWGTGFGLEFVHQYPELVHAWVGVNPTVDRPAEEARTYELVLAEAERRADAKAVAKLKEIGRPQAGLFRAMDDFYYIRNLTRKWNMITHDPASARRWGMSMLLAPEVGWSDLPRFIKGTMLGMPLLWPQFCRYNFMAQISELKVPVYLIVGRHEPYLAPADLAQRWLDQLTAPVKELIIFERSGHMAIYEEPACFNDLMVNRVLRDSGISSKAAHR